MARSVNSLRAQLLAWVLVPLACAVAVDGWITYRNARETATVVQDRLLLGSARIIAEQLRFEEGEIQDHVPPSALELFQSGQSDRVYYRVTTAAGQLLSGYGEVPLPAVELQPEVPSYFDTSVRSMPVRVVAYSQPVVGPQGAQPVLVQIAQTLRGHDELARSLWIDAVGQQLLILALVSVFILFGLTRGLRPLLHLRDMVLSRAPGALHPMSLATVPSELSPLVLAINDYVKRLEQYTDAQRVFIQDAAHQLRTPLTVLATQVSVSLRTTDFEVRGESLVAIRQTVQQAVRLVNQMLSLSNAEASGGDESPLGALALETVAQEVLENLSAQAQAKDIDLGFSMEGQVPPIMGRALAVREMLTNLVDNAIRYTPPGGAVTVQIRAHADHVTLTVEDNGPGIPPSQRERVFERFHRLDNRHSGGCGLGLPIVRMFADRIGATVSLQTPSTGQGLAAVVEFQCAPPPGGTK